MLIRVRSGRSGRRRGSQKPGTFTGKDATLTGAGSGARGACAEAPPRSSTPSNPKALDREKEADRTRAPNIVLIAPVTRWRMSSIAYFQTAHTSKIATQLDGELVGLALEIERRHEPSVLVHQINDG